jgi:hypothetical protein
MEKYIASDNLVEALNMLRVYDGTVKGVKKLFVEIVDRLSLEEQFVLCEVVLCDNNWNFKRYKKMFKKSERLVSLIPQIAFKSNEVYFNLMKKYGAMVGAAFVFNCDVLVDKEGNNISKLSKLY